MKRLYVFATCLSGNRISELFGIVGDQPYPHKLAITKRNKQCLECPIRLGLSVSLAVMAAFLFLNHPFGLIEEKVELSGLCVKDWHSTIDEPLDPEVVQTMCSLMRTQFPCSCFPC